MNDKWADCDRQTSISRKDIEIYRKDLLIVFVVFALG